MSDQEIEVINRKLDKISFYLNNDGDTGKKGVIAQVEQLSKDFYEFVDDYKRAVAVKNAKLGLLAFFGGCLAVVVEWVIKLVF